MVTVVTFRHFAFSCPSALTLLLGFLELPLPVLQGLALDAPGAHGRAVEAQHAVQVVEEGLEVGQGLLVVHVVLGRAAEQAEGVQPV